MDLKWQHEETDMQGMREMLEEETGGRIKGACEKFKRRGGEDGEEKEWNTTSETGRRKRDERAGMTEKERERAEGV